MEILFHGLVLFLSSLQAFFILSDEFLFHHKRGLGNFERIGHVMDTFFFLLPLSLASFYEMTIPRLYLYIALSIFSSLFITKDEWVHAKECEANEHWYHSVLFVSHGSLLLSIGMLWYNIINPFEIKYIFFGVLTFGLYQLVYWNIYLRIKDEKNK